MRRSKRLRVTVPLARHAAAAKAHSRPKIFGSTRIHCAHRPHVGDHPGEGAVREDRARRERLEGDRVAPAGPVRAAEQAMHRRQTLDPRHKGCE